MRVRCSWLLLLAACGGAEPLPVGEPLDEVSVLVRDDALVTPCAMRASLEIRAKLEISGVFGTCRVSLKEDGTALSLCDAVPGRQERDLELIYYYAQKQTSLNLVTVRTTIDLTNETKSMVEVDFSTAERTVHDEDGDGVSSFEELCVARDPRDGNG